MSIIMDMNTRRPVSSLSLSDQILHLTFHSLNHHVLSSHRLNSIYHDSISLSASDRKIQLSQLPSFKKAFNGVQTMLSFFIQSRMVYDSTKTHIRVSYNAMLVPKMGGKPVHIDGILVYSIDLSAMIDKDGNKRDGSGKIIEHCVTVYEIIV